MKQIHRMIPNYGTHGSRQQISNKSIQEEYNMVPCCRSIWLCSSVQTSAKKGKQFVSSTKWRLGENVIFRLTECLTPTFSFEKFMNNYSKSFGLLTHLGVSNIRATGVLNKNRLRKCTIVENKQLHWKQKGSWPL